MPVASGVRSPPPPPLQKAASTHMRTLRTVANLRGGGTPQAHFPVVSEF